MSLFLGSGCHLLAHLMNVIDSQADSIQRTLRINNLLDSCLRLFTPLVGNTYCLAGDLLE